jgi:hypothetical protein
MITLNLKTNNNEETLIKNYLENNVNETLAKKINEGTKLTKNDKTLINKKDLDGFMQYACGKAKEQAQKENYACIEDSIVYSWAIHYFEEDSIEGTLYNEDGSEYKEINTTTIVNQPKPQVLHKEKEQETMFDLLPTNNKNDEKELKNTENSEKIEEKQQNLSNFDKTSDLSYNTELEKSSKSNLLEDDENKDSDEEDIFDNDNKIDNQNKKQEDNNDVKKKSIDPQILPKNININYETGEIIEPKKDNEQSKDYSKILSNVLGDIMEIK